MSKLSRKDALAALERGDAQALGQPEAQVAQARALLASDDLAALGALPEPLLELVVAHAGAHGRQELLVRAAAAPARGLAKLAKKELYRLRSEGQAVELPRPAQPEPKPAAAAEPEAWPAFASCFLLDGLRAFIAARPDPRGSGQLEVWSGELSDREGFTNLSRGLMSRRNYKQLAREYRGGRASGLSWVEVSPAMLGGLLARHAALQKSPPPEVEQATRAFPGRPEEAAPASAAWAPLEGSAERGAVATASQLFLEPEVMTWLPSAEALSRLARRLDEVSVSRLVVDEAQRRQQAEHAVGHEVETSATPEERERLALRLFGTADLLQAQGRAERAGQAAAVARALRSGAPTSEIPFLRTLFEKALMEQIEGALARLPPEARARLAAEAGGPAGPGGLVLPGEAPAPAPGPEGERSPGGLILPGSRD